MSERLSSQRVTDVFMNCLYDESEVTPGVTPGDAVLVEGVVAYVGFHPARLETYRQQIVDMLMELPLKFREDSGGGWSFLNGCQDRNAKMWTSDQLVVEQLFLLGMAIGQVRELIPRSLWGILPGGVPYYTITN